MYRFVQIFRSGDLGDKTKEDYNKAGDYYQQAADQTLKLNIKYAALYNLGVMYLRSKLGYGTPLDYDKAGDYFKEVADQTVNLEVQIDAKKILNLDIQ